MATLIEAALRVAKRVGSVRSGTATGGSTTTLIDTSNTEQQGFFNGGVLWILSGTYAGSWVDILSFGSGTYTFKSALAGAIVSGVQYAAIPDDWSRDDLRNAVSEACKTISKILASDTTLVVVENQEEYSLPSGVSDVRRLEVADNASSPYTYQTHLYWRERNGVLYFHPDHLPDATAGNKIRLWYAKTHPDLADTGTMYWEIDEMQWAAVLYLLQVKFIATGKDHEWVAELYEKAELENGKAMRTLRRPPPKTAYMAGAF